MVIPKGEEQKKTAQQLYSARSIDGSERRKVVCKVKRVRIRLHVCVCVCGIRRGSRLTARRPCRAKSGLIRVELIHLSLSLPTGTSAARENGEIR